MNKESRKAHRLAALFLLGCLLFNYPLLSLFDKSGTILGVPVLYGYLFAAWALFIVLAAVIVGLSQ
jgi:predicted permease